MSVARCTNCGQSLSESGDCRNCATQAFPAERPRSDLHISGYDILGRIGEGGMGAIYLAEEKSLGRRVAIKVINARMATEPQAHARFMREARALATVEHPNVVRVYSFGEVETHPYLAMEYVDGETLSDRIRREGRLPIDESIRILRQILQALDAAWEKGIVHRDIKPSNVLIDRRGQVHVVDFGLAKPAHPDAGDGALTQEGSVLGTPYYLAPEQAQGQPTDFRADVYSCGILLYEMLSGERPFEGTTPLAIVAKHIHEPLPPIRKRRSDVPNRVVRLLHRMTDKRAAARASSYAELLNAIDALLGITPGRPIMATESISTIPIAASGRRYLVPASVAALMIIAAAAAFWRWRSVTGTTVSAPATQGFAVAVTPFYGPDQDSEREGRLMAALVERSIAARLGNDVRIIGIDETKTAVRHEDDARRLGEQLNASVVIWGEAFALRNETEIQPHFAIIRRDKASAPPSGPAEAKREDLRGADPTANLEARAPAAMRLEAQAPNQIELRKTSAEGVGEVVSLLAAVHALYTDNSPRKALAYLDHTSRSADALRCRADAYLQLNDNDRAAALYQEVLALAPNDVTGNARLGDLDLRAGKLADALLHYQTAIATRQPFTTQYGIAHAGLLYQRETYRSPWESRETDSGYLLAVDASNGRVTNRFRLPSFSVLQSFASEPGGFAITYRTKLRNVAQVLHFVNGKFDPPLVYVGGDLLSRMRSLKSGWALPYNFMGEVTGMIDQQPAHPRFRLRSDQPEPQLPTNLPALESALRAAIARDTTQPWHLFFLGQTLVAEGRAGEAQATWEAMFSRQFPVPYTNWTWMSKYFERFGQRELADRAWERSVRERARIAQPVQFTTLIERLINVPVARLHQSQKTDMDRAYLWLQRARRLSGITEGDHIAAAAWAAHFRRHNDPRAAAEEKYLQLARSHPFNFTAAAARLDYALDFWIATWFALFATTMILTSVALERARAAGSMAATNWRLYQQTLIETLPRLWAVIISSCVAVGIVYAAIMFRLEALSESSLRSSNIPHAFPLIAVVLAIVIARRLMGLGAVVSSLKAGERLLILILFAIALTAAMTAIRVVNRQNAIAEMPIGYADSIGNPDIVANLEERLAKHPTDALRYLTAVANDYAGNRARAQVLYAQSQGDPRAERALAALQKGTTSTEMPPAEEVYEALTAPAASWMITGGTPPEKFFTVISWVTLAFAATLLLTGVFVRSRIEAEPAELKEGWRVRLRKTAFLLLPGYYDLRCASLARGAALLTLAGFVGWLIATWRWVRIPTATGIISALATPNYDAAFPLPVDVRRIDLVLAAPHAMLFFAIAIASLLALVVLHTMRVREIWRYGRRAAEPTRIEPADTMSRVS